jgi:hypothetical protein
MIDVAVDCILQLAGAAVHPTSELLFGEGREEPLHQGEPRRARGREVQVDAGVPGQPAPDERGLVRAVVVQDQMHVQVLGDRCVDAPEERAKLHGAVPAPALGQDLAGLDDQGGEQRRGAMPDVVMRTPLNLTRAHRQQRLRAVQGLDLALLVQAQHQRLVRRIQVQPDDIAHLLDEQRVARELEGLAPMRLQAKGPPDPADGALTHPGAPGHRPRAPMRRVVWRGLQGVRDHAFHVRIGDRAGRAGTGFVQQPVHALGKKAPAPFADGLRDDLQSRRDLLIRQPLRRRHHDAGPLRQRLGGLAPSDPSGPGCPGLRRSG